jgi:hypothetical protein
MGFGSPSEHGQTAAYSGFVVVTHAGGCGVRRFHVLCGKALQGLSVAFSRQRANAARCFATDKPAELRCIIRLAP